MKNTVQVHRNRGTKPASVQTKTSRTKPQVVPTAGRIIEELRATKAQSSALPLQLRMDFRTLQSSIEASIALLMVLAEKSEDNGLQILTHQTIAKLNADARAVRAGFTHASSEVAS